MFKSICIEGDIDHGYILKSSGDEPLVKGQIVQATTNNYYGSVIDTYEVKVGGILNIDEYEALGDGATYEEMSANVWHCIHCWALIDGLKMQEGVKITASNVYDDDDNPTTHILYL